MAAANPMKDKLSSRAQFLCSQLAGTLMGRVRPRPEPAAPAPRLQDAFPMTPIVGAAVCLPNVDVLAAEFAEIAERQHRLGTRSMAAVPLIGESDCVGGLMLSDGDERSFTVDDRAFLDGLASVLTQAVRRGRAFEVQHAASEQLQRSLLPRSLPDLEGLSLGAYYRPGGVNVDVGGDWYDVLELADGSVLVSLGDVMGEGIGAAVVMGEVRAAMRAYALLDPAPEVVLSRLDQLVTTLAAPEQLVTAVYGLFAPDRRTVTIAVAGHPPPLLVPPVGDAILLDGMVGPALGLATGPWTAYRVEMAPGTTLLLFSDGLVESRSVDLFSGIEDLRERVASMPRRRRNPREMVARLGQLSSRDTTDDDVTLLAVSVTSPLRSRSAVVELPGDATAARKARRFMRETLADWALDQEVVDTAELCVSELVTNSVIHSGSPSNVTAHIDDECLLVLVRDRGAAETVQQSDDYEPMSISGRGLTLVNSLTTAWSAEHSADATTVWFELGVAPATALRQ